MTRLEILADALARSLTTDAVIGNTAINDAYKDIVGKCELNPKKTTLTLTAGVESYVLTSTITDFNGLYGIYYNGSDGPGILEAVDLTTILQMRAAYAQSAAPLQYSLIGNAQLELFPNPSTTGSTLVVWYYAFGAADALAADATVPVLIPSEYHDVIGLRASMMLASRYESAGENRDLGQRIFAEYQGRFGELRAFLRRHASSQPQRLRVGYPRRPRIRPATPSTDVSGTRW